MRAWELRGEGWAGKDIAATLNVRAAAVSGWLKRARTGGVEALRGQPAPGPTPKLTAEQRAALPDLLARGRKRTASSDGRLLTHIQDTALRGPATRRTSMPARASGTS